MDLGPNASSSMLSTMSGIRLHFDSFDDEVSKESNDLTVDASFSMTTESDQKNTEYVDISQVALLDHDSSAQNASDLLEAQEKRKGGWPKGKKRKKCLKDINAPRQPLTGYVRFLNERREKLRQEHPTLSFADISRQLGTEWSQLPPHDKQHYLDDAEKDKARYMREMDAYQKTEAYKLFKVQQDKKKLILSEDPSTSASIINGPPMDIMTIRDEEETGTFDIPIFTEEFLDHNKGREGELRQLRKQTTELEEQNAILSKHIENMKHAIEKLEIEAVQQRSNNMALQGHLDALRTTLTTNFATVPLPGTMEVPTLESIDTYMAKLHSIILDSPQENEGLIANVRDIVGRLNIEGDKL